MKKVGPTASHRINVEVKGEEDVALWKRCMHICIDEETSVRDLVFAALRLYIEARDEHRESQGKE